MITTLELDKVRDKISQFFEKMGFLVEINISSEENNNVLVELESEEPRVLIGRNGEVLTDIQRLLGLIVRREFERPLFINFDINNYKKKKAEYLKETANSLADTVSLMRKEKVLNPMPSYERRVIHLELAERDDVVTESIGQGEERRVVIKPKS